MGDNTIPESKAMIFMLSEMFRWHPLVLVNYSWRSPCLADTLSLMSYLLMARAAN